ncbi:hypothetical protein AYI69_g11071, partial [Smittium culicis]
MKIFLREIDETIIEPFFNPAIFISPIIERLIAWGDTKDLEINK